MKTRTLAKFAKKKKEEEGEIHLKIQAHTHTHTKIYEMRRGEREKCERQESQ